MKTLRNLGIIIVVTALIAGAAWRWHQNAGPNTQTDTPVTVLPAGQKIAAPTVQPAPMSDKSAAVLPEDKYRPRADLNDTITDAISYLESHDVADFIKTFSSPQMLEVIRKAGNHPSIDALIQHMRENPGLQTSTAEMLESLRSIQSVAPTINEDGTRAIYRVDPPIKNAPDAWIFQKVDGVWYVD